VKLKHRLHHEKILDAVLISLTKQYGKKDLTSVCMPSSQNALGTIFFASYLKASKIDIFYMEMMVFKCFELNGDVHFFSKCLEN